MSYLYFPIAGEQGIKGAVTLALGGDLKRNQNEFILQPVSAEELHNNKSTRNFWCYLGEKACFSATGVSAEAQAQKFTDRQDKSSLTAGPMWQLVERRSEEYGLSARILSFVPVSDYCVEIMHVEIKNESDREVCFTPTAVVPLYGRSADNLRDHRHVTSLLHRAVTEEKGVFVTPALSFDERGHQKNHITYYVCGMEENGAAPVGFMPVVEDYIGGRGWRDLWQDCLALLIMNPDGVRQMLIDNYGGVRIDGSNATIIGSRQGEFIADRNNITRVWMDHGLWPLMTTKLYIDQTGDLPVLLKENTYFKDKQEARGTRTDDAWTADIVPVLKTADGRAYAGTILEHILVQNLTVFYEVGDHNHMRLRGADWNDALDMAPNRGESVAFTAAFADNLEAIAGLIGLLAEKEQIHTIEILKELEPLLKTGVDFYEDIE